MRNFQIIAPVFIAEKYSRIMAMDLDNKETVTLLFRGKMPEPNFLFSVTETELLPYKILPATSDQKDTAMRKLLLLNPHSTSLETQMKEKEIVIEALAHGMFNAKSKVAQDFLQKIKKSAQEYKEDYVNRLSR